MISKSSDRTGPRDKPRRLTRRHDGHREGAVMGNWDVDPARIAEIRNKPLEQAVVAWDRRVDAPVVDAAAAARQLVLDRFPIAAWPELPLEQYALGTEFDESFCKLIEFRTQVLGGIGGGSAKKHLIFRRADGNWYHRAEYANETEAWDAVRAGFVRGFALAEAGDWSAIDSIPAIANASSLRAKTYAVYFPDGHVPIFATSLQASYYKRLGGEGPIQDGVAGTRALWNAAQQTGLFDGWTPVELGRFLWAWGQPSTAKRIVKIAPGHDGQFWDQCRQGGYICVGWDETGDLREFESKDEYRRAFAEKYSDYSPSKATEKSNELWTLMELQPGDIVLANRGTGTILGRGQITEPGYVWRPDRGEWAFHTLTVDWEEIPPWDIDPIKHWAFTTVSTVSAEQYQRINARRGAFPPGGDVGAVPPDPELVELAKVLERKLQVVLYGPPGTGKTYTARRFSTWWLSTRAGLLEANSLLGNRNAFRRAEGRLSTAQAERRVWWLVANPSEWNWEKLATERTQTFKYGRLKRNYPLLQPGDLVVGYSSNPEKKIAALARITKGLHTLNGEPQIELEWVADIQDGPTYQELRSDARLAASEPMRFRNQGTLFALTADEADYLLALLQERNEGLDVGQDADSIGQLTRVTFHPSYTYEDFVEGFKPVPTGTGQLDLRLVDGVFKRVCRAAQADPERPYLLVIDEINRGNIPKIFGELVTLLEGDKRELTVVLPQSRETFSVPRNVHVLGTMNTADRSIKLLDAALRRRFAFVELMPDVSTLAGGKVGDLDLAVFLSSLNANIARTEGREKQVGHSFLLTEDGEPVSSREEFAERFRYEILPLLQEYAYEDYAELASYLGPRLVNVQDQQLDAEVLSSPDDLIDALRAHFQPRATLVDQLPGVPEESGMQSDGHAPATVA